MLNRRTVITFEKLERTLYRLPNCAPVVGHCPQCCMEVSWLTPDQVVAVSGLTLREIFRRIEAQTVHFKETPPTRLYLCPNSLGFELGE
jgi:hypothetical protein